MFPTVYNCPNHGLTHGQGLNKILNTTWTAGGRVIELECGCQLNIPVVYWENQSMYSNHIVDYGDYYDCEYSRYHD